MKDNSKSIQYNSIEILRIIFTFAIIVFHILGIIDPKVEVYQYCRHARVIVEFFFIISGYFVYKTFLKEISLKIFIIKRFIRLWPVLFIGVLLITLQEHIAFYKALPSMIMLTSLGFKNCQQVLGYCWYIYVLFWVSIFYGCLIKTIKDKIKLSVIILLLIYMGLMILTNDHSMFVQTFKNFFTIFNGGVLRGTIGLGIGILIALHFDKIKININKVFFTLVEIFIFSYLIAQIFFVSAKNVVNTTLVFIILFSILFICLINNWGYFSNILNKFNVLKISKYCYSWYVVQCISKNILSVEKLNNIEYFFLSLFCTIVFGILTYHFIEKPGTKFLSNIFFPQSETLVDVERERERE